MDDRSRIRALWDALAAARSKLEQRDAATIETQIILSEVAAPTGHEQERGACVLRYFEALGLTALDIDKAGNVLGSRAGTEDVAPVVICAHLDTVFPRSVALKVQREGPRMIGPGIGDNGRGLAAMLAIADVLDGKSLRTRAPVVFAATVGEEGSGDLRGAKELFSKTLPNAGAAIALDGAGDERIVHRALGSRRFRLHYRGAGGHSWTAFGVPNAAHDALGGTNRRRDLDQRNPRRRVARDRPPLDVGNGTQAIRERDSRGGDVGAPRGKSARHARRAAAHARGHGDRRQAER
jgi:acetylornithine deacetylase/succinyl-diaminopimelate desuccinylase-like protein